jgi:hypothetical protein
MSGWIYALDERTLIQSSTDLRRIIDVPEPAAWHRFWCESGSAVVGLGIPEYINEDHPPAPHSNDLLYVLRAAARSRSLRQAELWERAWHVHYPELSDQEAGFEVSESAEYEAIGDHVFTVGRLPLGLEFRDEQPDFATNWVGHKAVSRLWEMETEEGFLGTAGANLVARGTPLGHDLLAVRGMLEFGAARGAGLYVRHAGT